VRIGTLIHALNAGETKVAEAAGVQTLLQGAVRRTGSDEQLLAACDDIWYQLPRERDKELAYR